MAELAVDFESLDPNWELRIDLDVQRPGCTARIEELWHKAQESNPKLFKGGILFTDLDHFKRGVCGIADYSLLMASKSDPSSFPSELRFVGVTGIVSWRERLLLGRRSVDSTFYPGEWEFMPAGILEPPRDSKRSVDVQLQLSREFFEETGQPLSKGASLRRVGYLNDFSTKTIDILYFVELPPSEDWEAKISASEEHHELYFYPQKEAKSLFHSKQALFDRIFWVYEKFCL